MHSTNRSRSTVKGALLCASTTKKGDNDQQKKKKISTKADASSHRRSLTRVAKSYLLAFCFYPDKLLLELLDFSLQSSVIFRRITREIAHQPSIESSGTSPDPTRLNAAELLFYFSVKLLIGEIAENWLFWRYFLGTQVNLQLMGCNRVK